jgi:preprotein translocase subunit SecG
MKPVILFFFAIILVYSLSSGKEEKKDKGTAEQPSKAVILLDETKKVEHADSSVIVAYNF